MRLCLAAILAFLLFWPLTARSETLVIELECHDATLVRDAMRSGEITPAAMALNADGELVILFSVTGGGYWLGLVIENGVKVCGLSAGPEWQNVIPGQPT